MPSMEVNWQSMPCDGTGEQTAPHSFGHLTVFHVFWNFVPSRFTFAQIIVILVS